MEEADALVTIATETRNNEDFRLAMNKQNKLKKDILKERAENMKRNLNGKENGRLSRMRQQMRIKSRQELCQMVKI